MKQKFNIKHNEEVKQVSIEPVVYQDKPMYEVEINGEYFVVYREGEIWKQEADEKLDKDLFEQLVNIIETNSRRLQTQ